MIATIKYPQGMSLRIFFAWTNHEVIEKRAEIIPLDYPLVLEIHNKTFSAEQKITVRKLIKNRFTFISINKEAELKRIKQKSYYFLILGIVTL